MNNSTNWISLAEADVHTATPSLGNAAATWAGWAVTAVAAKFYRSQSDTGRPQRPSLTGKAKPASLGTLEYPFDANQVSLHRISSHLKTHTLITAANQVFFIRSQSVRLTPHSFPINEFMLLEKCHFICFVFLSNHVFDPFFF